MIDSTIDFDGPVPEGRLAFAQSEGLEANIRRMLAFIECEGIIELQALDVRQRPGATFLLARAAHATTLAEVISLAKEAERFLASGVYVLPAWLRAGVETRHSAPGRWFDVPKDGGTTDSDVARRRVLAVDCDVKRPGRISATDLQMSHSIEVAGACWVYLARLVGEDALALVHSGNGRQIWIAVDAPASAEIKLILAAILVGLAFKFDTEAVNVDTRLFDPKRILPACGTTKKKGVAGIADRPHRRTAIVTPEKVRRLSEQELRNLHVAIHASLDEAGQAAMDKAQGVKVDTRAKPGPRSAGDPKSERGAGGHRPFDTSNALDTRAVAAWLGLLDSGELHCPGCGEVAGVGIIEHGLKCFHHRCSDKGREGFRTNVDLTMEVRGVDAHQAVCLLAEQFGFEPPRSQARKGDGEGATPEAPACDAPSEPATDGGGRPVIRHQPSRFQPDVLASVEALGAAGGVYVSGPRLVQISRASTRQQHASRWTSSDGRTRFDVVAGSPLIARLPQSVLKMRLSEAASFKRYVATRGGWVNSAPPDDVVTAVHELGSWDLPRINGVAETPIFREDGSVADTDGYDEQTGYWIERNAKFPPIPARPTKDQARAAYVALAEPFSDFPYVRREQAVVSVAAILTVVAAPAIRGSRPGIVYDASAGGTGKTLSTDAVAMITTGRPASRKAYPATDEECEKAFASYALRGSPLISMDDIKRPLGGENLDRVLTARRDVDFRRLGKTELMTMPWVATLLFTGVNITFSGQMARRVLVSRIESRLERPQDRQDFLHPDLLLWITAERPRLVAAALTLLRAFAVADYPDAGLKRWGSFEEWSRLIPPAIVFAGGPDVLECRPPDDDEDAVADVAMLRSVLSGLRTLCDTEAQRKERKPEEGLTSGEIVASLYCRPPPFEKDKQLLGVALRELIGAQIADPSAQAVGTHLAKHKGRPLMVGEHLLRLVKIKDTTKATGDRWAVEVVTP